MGEVVMNPHAWLADAERVWPERLNLPDELDGADRLTLAEARSRLTALSKIVGELKRLVEAELAPKLEGGVLRYGDHVLSPARTGSKRVIDPDGWWLVVAQALAEITVAEGAALLKALYSAGSVHLTGIPHLAAVAGYSAEGLRSTFIDFDPPSSPVAALPQSRWYKWHHRLADGQFSGDKVPTKEDNPEVPK